MVEAIQKAVQDICLSVLGLIGGVCLFRWAVAMTRRFFMGARTVGLVVSFSVAFAVAVMFGGSKTNGLLQAIFPFVPQVQQTQLVPLVPSVVQQGIVPIPAATSPRASATMPFRAAHWNMRGAWNDSFRYAFLGDWVFPFGTGRLDRVEVCSQGLVIPNYGSTNVIASVGVPLEIVNPITSFGCGPTDANSYVFAWTNAVIGRVLHEDIANAETLDASIEFFRNGDIEVTTNGVSELIPRIHPSDVDGDGIPDVVDPNPGVWDGDLFGPRDELPPGANTNAYCWVDVVVSGADAEVLFTGDGPSNLPDPHFMARAGATNRVTILVGKGYAVSADERIECVGTSDPEIEVARTGETAIFVRRPVAITFDEGASPPLRDGSSHGISRTMNVVPDCLGGEFEWATNHCCDISMSRLSFAWNCLGECGCGGCQATGRYVYEGYGLDVSGGNCGCSPPSSPPEESPSLGVSFSEDALFYEEAYTNRPGEVVGRRISTNATMVARLPVAKDFVVATNHAGGAGMNLEIYVQPETVAFNGIAMEEIPSQEGVHQGYFSNIHFSNRWYHTTEMSAGRWENIKPNNLWDVDRAWMGDELPRELPNGTMTFDLLRGEWSEGLLVWNITWGWGEPDRSDGDPPIKAMTVRYDQTFMFDEYGLLTVSKFNNTVSRGTNNVIRLNGNIVTGVPLTQEEINEANGNE